MLRHNAAGAVALAATAVVALSFKEWSATLNPLNGSTISGSATAQPAVGDSLIVGIRIKGARLGPWAGG